MISSTVVRLLITFSISNFIGGLLGSVIVILLIWVWFGTGYKVENDVLEIQSGPFKKIVNLQEIHKISKKKSAWSSAALAMDRLVIQYGKYNWDIHISPKQEFEFIKLLVSKNPKIEIEG